MIFCRFEQVHSSEDQITVLGPALIRLAGYTAYHNWTTFNVVGAAGESHAAIACRIDHALGIDSGEELLTLIESNLGHKLGQRFQPIFSSCHTAEDAEAHCIEWIRTLQID